MSFPTTTAPARLVLVVLFAGAFVMGCAEMLVVGLLDLIADDLSVSVPAAGALVTANALGLAFGGPALAFLTTRFDRRTVLLGTLAVFVVSNALPAVSAGYGPFVAARVLTGAAQGLFIAAAMTTAVSVVPPERAGRAMAAVISGFATASALGLPLGTLLGQAVGWRGSFVAVVAVAAVVLVIAAAVVPSVPAPPESGALAQARHAFAPAVLAVLALCVLVFAALQAALTYLVPYLATVTGVSGAAVSLFLLAYGVATTIGSYGGGRFADLDAARSLVVGSVGVMASLVAMLLLGAHPVPTALTVLGLGLFGMGMAPSMQHRVVSLAGPGAALASSLPASAVNVGIASGSFAGGLAIDHGGIHGAVLTGIVVAGLAVAVAWTARTLTPAPTTATPQACPAA